MQLNTDISSINRNNINNISQLQSTEKTEKLTSSQGSLSDKVYGEVKNLTRNQITVITDSGESLTGKILNPELLKIGMSGEFKIMQLNSAEIALSLVSSARQDMQQNVLNDTLAALGFKVNDENRNILKMLLDNSFPATKENFQKLNQAIKVVGADNPKEAIFFLNNNIKPSFKAAEVINSYINGEIKLSNQLSALTDNILNSNNSGFLQKAAVYLGDNVTGQIEKSIENFNTIKSELLNDIDNMILKNEEIKPMSLDNVSKLAYASENIEGNEISNFIKQNSKEFLNIIRNSVLSNNLEKLPQIIKDSMNLPKTIENLSEKEFFSELFKVFSKMEKPISDFIYTKENISKFFINSLTINPRNIKDKNLGNHLENISEKLLALKNEAAAQTETPNMAQTIKLIDNISNNLNFFSSMQNTVFMQIPVIINNKQETAELYVFKDKNKSRKKSGKASALIALDTAFLGHFEVYIQKNNNSISCQFRLKDDNIKNIVSENINLLSEYLKNYNLNLDSVAYKKTEEPFNIAEPEPAQESIKIKDFTFDMQT